MQRPLDNVFLTHNNHKHSIHVISAPEARSVC